MFDLSPFKPKKEDGIRVVLNPYRYCIEINNLSKERFFYMVGVTSAMAKKGVGYARNKVGIPYDIMFNDIPLFHSEVVRAVDNKVRGNKILEKKPTNIEEMKRCYQVVVAVGGPIIGLKICLGKVVVANRKLELKIRCKLPLKGAKGKELQQKFFSGNRLEFNYTAQSGDIDGNFILKSLAKYTEKWEKEMFKMAEAKELNRFQKIRKMKI